MFADPKYKDFSLWEKFNEKFQIDLIKMSTSHSYYMTALFFLNGINDFEKSGACKNLIANLRTLFRIFALHTLTKHGAALAISNYLTPNHFRQINEQLLSEYHVIRPNMLSLIEAYELDDNITLSAIGNYDGNVYERMLEWAKSSRLNQKDKLDGFEEFIKPMLTAKL